MTEYDSIRKKTVDAIDRGAPEEAFTTFRIVLEFPGRLDTRERWVDALEIFADLSTPIAGDEFAATVRAAAADPDDADALYALGYQLIEQSLPGIAATALSRAQDLAPGNEHVLSELVCALENDGRNGEAVRRLRAAPQFAGRFLFRYLLAFNSIMTADLEEARKLLPGLRKEKDPDCGFMTDRIERMLRRADLAGPLDRRHLRGWHYVLTGGILLHLSPHGREEMNGRYAYTSDSKMRWTEAIRRLAATLEAWSVEPERVLALTDPMSRELAQTASTLLECPIEPWPSEKPGLIVAYDLLTVDEETFGGLYQHRPGQILWAHASCWTRELPYAADLTTYLYQVNVPPKEAEGPADPIEDLHELAAFSKATRPLAAAFVSQGPRERQWYGSPVSSNRFL